MKRYKTKEYPFQDESKFVTTQAVLFYASQQFRFSRVKPYEISLTPRYPSEENAFIFTFKFERHVLNEDGTKLVDLQRRYAFRLWLEDLTPTVDELFSLIKGAHSEFSTYFYDKVKDTELPKNLIKELNTDEVNVQLINLISHWERNLKHVIVDKDGVVIE